MRYLRLTLYFIVILLVASCAKKEKKIPEAIRKLTRHEIPAPVPVDQGFSQFITGFTSGVISSGSSIEIRFTPEFAAVADKTEAGLFSFDPNIKGRSEWKNDNTLIFTPSGSLDPGRTYTGTLNLGKIASVNERYRSFPLRFQVMRRDFRIIPGMLECDPENINDYIFTGEVALSDNMTPEEVQSLLSARIGRRKLDISWDHGEKLYHKFTVNKITREVKEQELILEWDGSRAGISQKGSKQIIIPPSGYFTITDVIKYPGQNPRIDIVFSDPPDESQDLDGLIRFNPWKDISISTRSNVVSVFPEDNVSGTITLSVEAAVRNSNGITLPGDYSKILDFSVILPGIKTVGKGVILPAAKNLIFPFSAANLKAVDLKIIRIFENNLPHFLQENDIDQGYSVKRFGRPVYSGRYDLISGSETNTGTWNLYTINLADFIDIEPGVLYKVILSMRKSYSLHPCTGDTEEGNYEEMLDLAEQQNRDAWDDPDNYFEDTSDELYYSYGFRWEDRDDPCRHAYYSPDKKVTRNIIASNFGIIAKMGTDMMLRVMVNDLISALPVNEASIEVLDYQLQVIASGQTNPDGSSVIKCDRKPFLISVQKDKDRNFLKVNDGSALSLSSFDVSGTIPVNGIKAFVYGERDVWRPGDSIFLSVMIRDMKKELPEGHPVHFELINPDGQKIDYQVLKINKSGLLAFSTKTTAEAVTGNYTAGIKVGGAHFTKRLRIESVKPNRLKINLDFGDDILGGSKPVATGTLSARWLNGAVAGNLKASVEYLLKKTKTEFDNYRQYDFDDPVSEFYPETVSVFNDNTDGSGNASFIFNPGNRASAPGMMNAVFTARVSERGGDESIIQTTCRYAPFKVFAGINLPGLQGKGRMLFTDQDNTVKIVTVNEEGRPVNSEAEVSIYKISYRWWWESDEENLGYFISNNIYKPVFSKSLVTRSGEASFSFRVDRNDWGRYLIRVTTPEGHSTGKIVLVDWPWEYGMKSGTDGATMLTVNTDREKYAPGDEIKLSFPSPENSRAIITLENGTGVIEEIRMNTARGNTVVKIPVKPGMASNVYAYATVIQPHDQTINDMPARLYGIVPVMIEDPQTRLSPRIDISDELRSQKPFTVKVSEAGRKPMNYTLAIVDEGLLDITGYKTPDPWNYFYSREALGVMTWDLYDLVLGSYGGTLERLFAVGGDEAVIDRSAGKAQRFVPVVKFLGPFSLEAGKTNTHALVLPQYTGSVRTMVIAGNEGAFGFAERSSFVRDPLMILATAPRSVSPGDRVDLPLTLFVQKEGLKEVKITAVSDDLVTFSGKSKNVILTGYETDTGLSFTAGNMTGVSKITIRAEGTGETAVFDLALEIRNPNPPQVLSELKILKPGEKWEKTFMTSKAGDNSSASLAISSMPSIDIGKRLDYLVSYPHGCTEQIISAAFPQLWVKSLTAGDNNMTQKAVTNISKAIEDVFSRQMVSGGMALWPGAVQADSWLTSYAGHFMTEAERMGYSIPSGFMQNWTRYQKARAREWKHDPAFRHTATDQAYRLFTMALAGQADKSSMNRLRETNDLPGLSGWLLAAAYAITGREEVAADLLDMRKISEESEYRDHYYGGEMRDKSIILYTLTLLGRNEEALILAGEICDKFSNDTWYSTQTTGWGLFAYMKWAEKMQSGKNAPSGITLSFNGNKNDLTVKPGKIIIEDLKTEKDNTLVLENTSENNLYASLTVKSTPAAGEETRDEKGLMMKIDYFDRELRTIDPGNLRQGTDFIMAVRITNTGFSGVDNLALTTMVPSGWEIRNTRLFEASVGIKESAFGYRDFRDDRVNTYFSLRRGETKTYLLLLNASYRGEFYQPSVSCEAMYKASVHSLIPGRRVTVTGDSFE